MALCAIRVIAVAKGKHVGGVWLRLWAGSGVDVLGMLDYATPVPPVVRLLGLCVPRWEELSIALVDLGGADDD